MLRQINIVIVGGEITTRARLDFTKIAATPSAKSAM